MTPYPVENVPERDARWEPSGTQYRVAVGHPHRYLYHPLVCYRYSATGALPLAGSLLSWLPPCGWGTLP